MKAKREVTASSGNVFADLGLASPEEAQAKAALTVQISELISARSLTQAAAARLLGVDQPKVSALLRGHLSGFSTERLMRFLTALGSNVQIVVRHRPGARGRGHLKVLSA